MLFIQRSSESENPGIWFDPPNLVNLNRDKSKPCENPGSDLIWNRVWTWCRLAFKLVCNSFWLGLNQIFSWFKPGSSLVHRVAILFPVPVKPPGASSPRPARPSRPGRPVKSARQAKLKSSFQKLGECDTTGQSSRYADRRGHFSREKWGCADRWGRFSREK